MGTKAAIDKVCAAIENTVWRVTNSTASANGEFALDIGRDQTTEAAAIRELTEYALGLEMVTGTRYDGWATVAKRSN